MKTKDEVLLCEALPCIVYTLEISIIVDGRVLQERLHSQSILENTYKCENEEIPEI